MHARGGCGKDDGFHDDRIQKAGIVAILFLAVSERD
ncbi:uncharacterized protein CMC5_045570 [Chondromyces crocatus]|uniref:Uncharacterized protein n=1 Tax=Chondromyces crocatus TaxID=52 RepID=A0A0K1EHS0_CHOCO|nr:uncharacterized protein CMC5_045570 [Chondromyces crocatus]